MKAGKQLRKTNMFIDITAMGELEENEHKLRELVGAKNGTTAAAAREDGAAAVERTCHFITILAGVFPSDLCNQSHSTGGWRWWRRHMGKRVQEVPVVPEQVEEETILLPTLEEWIPICIPSWPWLYVCVWRRSV